MLASTLTAVEEIDSEGFTIIGSAFSHNEVAALVADLTRAIVEPCDATAVRSRAGNVYAARNILSLWPQVADVWRRPQLVDPLECTLGAKFGLVRVLFFDKPPEQTWTLPWHKDLTIAVREHRASAHFCKPTRKAGVAHVEAPVELLENMLTARIHLDDVTEENGPLRVIPGSHKTGKTQNIDKGPRRDILVQRGDVLLIRPLVSHCSVTSQPGTTRHRRILHLEFAGSPELADGFQWHDYIAR